MTSAVPLSVEYGSSLAALMEPIRRVAAARGADSNTIDDVVQETLVRLMAQRERLEDDALLPYALVTARNLVAGIGRDVSLNRRHAHRLLDRREPERPEDVALRREEERALGTALADLSPEDREILLRHEVAGEDTALLAAAGQSTSGGVAARLARARAKLRVDFLLQLRGVTLPTARCRPVLLALSAGDRRRQQRLGAGRHLLTCTTCTDLSEPLVQRRRALAGIAPWLGLPAAANLLRPLVKGRKAQVATSVATAGTAAVVGLAVTQPWADHPAPPTAPAARVPAPVLAVGGRSLLPLPGDRLAGYVGKTVTAAGVRVQSVPADEGFWVGESSTRRVWVQLVVPAGGESKKHVRVGDLVSFRGPVVANSPGFPARVGVSAAEGAEQLERQRAHIRVSGDVLPLS